MRRFNECALPRNLRREELAPPPPARIDGVGSRPTGGTTSSHKARGKRTGEDMATQSIELDRLLSRNKSLIERENESYERESNLRTLLDEVYATSSDKDTLEKIADIFNFTL